MIPINKRKISVCIILTIFTLGIYGIYWKYLILKNTKSIRKDDSKCLCEMLCLVLVPFYPIYWWFKSGKIVRTIFSEHGYTVRINEKVYLVFGIFNLDIVSMAFMQSDFNSLTTEYTQTIKRSAENQPPAHLGLSYFREDR